MANYFEDRIVQHPGRFKLTPVAGSSDTYDLERAEGTVTTAGTPFEADTFNGIAQDILDHIPINVMYYATCSTSGGTAAKVASCTGFTLFTGATVAVYMTNDQTYDGQITLNVNGTGAKNVYDNGQYMGTYTKCAWEGGQVMIFVYDGTRWRLCNGDIITDSELSSLESALGL